MNQSRYGPERSRKLILRWRPVSFFLPFSFCILLPHKHYIYIQGETELTRYMNIFVGFNVTKYVYIRINVFSNGVAFYFLHIIVINTLTVYYNMTFNLEIWNKKNSACIGFI